MMTGGRPPPPVRMRAPSCRSGAATRSIGLRESEASPTSVAGTPAPASMPHNSRRVVPELPQSSSATGGRNARKPPPRTIASSAPMSGSASGNAGEPGGRAGATNAGSLRAAIHGVPSPRSSGTPSCARHRAVERTSPPGASPAMRLSPSASAANRSARCEMLLSPGTRMPAPCTARRSGCTRAFTRGSGEGDARWPVRRLRPRASAARSPAGRATAFRRKARGPDPGALR